MTALSSPMPLGSDLGSVSGGVGVFAEGERRGMADDNEGKNCFHWILKSKPQCIRQAAHGWNNDDSGENKRK